MKRLNMFELLSREDQNLVLDLCDRLPYAAVVEQLAKPRSEGGLSLTTSITSLSRFYTACHPDAVNTEVLGQYAHTMQFVHQAHSGANYEAMVALAQNRIIAALKQGRALKDLDYEFRTLERLQKCLVTERRWQRPGPSNRLEYFQQVERFAHRPEADFIDNNLPDDPGAEGLTPEDFEEPTQIQDDIDFARAHPGKAVQAALPQNSTSKKPVFPHFPPDFAPSNLLENFANTVAAPRSAAFHPSQMVPPIQPPQTPSNLRRPPLDSRSH